MAHIDWAPMTDPSLELLEAVASFDVRWCEDILLRFQTTYQNCTFPKTLKEASSTNNSHSDGTTAALEPALDPAVVDLINNARDEDGYTPLILAFLSPEQHGAIPMINFLVKNGADVSRVPISIRTRIDYERVQPPICRDFRKKSFKQSLLVPMFDCEAKKAREERQEDENDILSFQNKIRSKKRPFDLPSATDSYKIEMEKYKYEERERNDLFYMRGVARGTMTEEEERRKKMGSVTRLF